MSAEMNAVKQAMDEVKAAMGKKSNVKVIEGIVDMFDLHFDEEYFIRLALEQYNKKHVRITIEEVKSMDWPVKTSEELYNNIQKLLNDAFMTSKKELKYEP